MTFLNRVVGLTLVMVCACNAHAGMLEEVCSLVYKKLSSGSYESLAKSIESFTDDGKLYHGCVIRRLKNANKATDTQHLAISLDTLFGAPLPYCPDGKLPADIPSDLLNEDGWCGDQMADGADGRLIRLLRKTFFAQ